MRSRLDVEQSKKKLAKQKRRLTEERPCDEAGDELADSPPASKECQKPLLFTGK